MCPGEELSTYVHRYSGGSCDRIVMAVSASLKEGETQKPLASKLCELTASYAQNLKLALSIVY